MGARLDHIGKRRQEKLSALRALGIDPYPYACHRSHTVEEALALFEQQEAGGETGESVSVAGRVMANRSMGKTSFLDIRDGFGKMQLFFRRDVLGTDKFTLLRQLDIGDIIGASGKVFRTKSGEPTIEVEDFILLAKSLQPLPEKWHGLSDIDKRYRQRYLDLIANAEVKEVFRVRSLVITAIRQFLNRRGFLEVETPVLQASAGGAAARPFVTHHHTLDQDFYLRIALELYLKRLIIGGFDKVYELGRIFRNEGLSTKHNPEFTMLESYEAYADYNDVMEMLQEMVSGVCREVLGTDKVVFGEASIDFKPPWQRLTLRDAVREYSGLDFVQYPEADLLRAKMQELGLEVDPEKDWAKLVDGLVSTFVEPKLIQPTFLLDYPVSMSPLAKRKPDSDRVVERFEAFAGGMEIANAFTELNDPLEQRQRFISQQESRQGEDDVEEYIDQDFLLAMEHGMPPTGGLGVGIDRLVMLLTNRESIREVILFPHLREKE
ncbi:lysine--tRNA ligase [Chloroflexota bacterium]